jgi:hypothetical protein
VIGILEFKTSLAGAGYPTGKNTRAGTGMGKILYPRVYMGNPTGRIFFDGYEYGMVLPDGYVLVAIPTLHHHRQVLNGLKNHPNLVKKQLTLMLMVTRLVKKLRQSRKDIGHMKRK